MSGERVELRRIENRTDRQMSFRARKNELLEKAYHLSVLCDAEAALIIFSDRGKLYQFGSAATINKTLERYQLCTYHGPQLEAERGSLKSLQEAGKTDTDDEGSTFHMHPLKSLYRQVAPPEEAKEINTGEDSI